MDEKNGVLFDESYVKELKSKFYYADSDPEMGKRLFFDNSGGSLRLKAAVEAKMDCEAWPDCPERSHPQALKLKDTVRRGTDEMRELVFGAKSGAVMTELTASQTMFQLVRIIMESVPGTNAVVSALEHPSAYDAVAYYCERLGRELRVIPADPATGGIDPDTAASFVDGGTCLLSVMSASNISGAIMDMEAIVRKSRAVKPDLYIISDAVQHAPHCQMHAGAWGLDGVNFAPYKFFGVRGCGYAWLSGRAAKLSHHKLLGKEQTVFELGTPSPGNFAAMSAVIDYVCAIGARFAGDADRTFLYAEGMRRIHLQERALLHRMLEGTPGCPGLRHIPGVRVYADAPDLTKRDLIAGIGIDGVGFSQLVEEYRARGVIVCERVRESLYSKRIVEALGIPGAVRVSPMHCHGTEDIDRFLAVTREIAADRTR